MAQTETPVQLCSPISTGTCASLPHWLKPSGMKFSRRSTGTQAEEVVGLSLVVGADGSVRDVEVAKSSGDELTQEVVASAKSWKFQPGTFQGRAVAVQMRVIVQFHASGDPSINFAPWRASWTTGADLQKLFDEAYQADARHDYEKAITLSRQLIALEPLYRRIRLTLGQALVELQEYNEAEAVIQEEIKLDPKSPFAYNMLGQAYQRHRKYDEAISQFRKQIEVTPEAFNPHANLGVLLASRKRCSEAMPELEKALELSPGQARALLAEGECDVDAGDTAKGVSEMEQAANQAASSASWNQAAYRLAERNVELDKARKWAEKAITIEATYLRDLSLDHATPTQMRLVNTVANYWDTLGWVYFRMGNDGEALRYVDAAWRMHSTPTKGDHLGQIYEKLGRREDAIGTYAMALAAADLSKRGASSPEDLAEALDRLTQLSGQGADLHALIERGHSALEALSSIPIGNPAKHIGSADFTLRVVGNKIMDVRQVAGDASFAAFSETLRKSPLSVHVPEESGLEILRRGTLSCKLEGDDCHFVLLTTEDAVDIATKEEDAAKRRTTD